MVLESILTSVKSIIEWNYDVKWWEELNPMVYGVRDQGTNLYIIEFWCEILIISLKKMLENERKNLILAI